MTDYPVGYNRHNIISVTGDDYEEYIGELNQMHFVEKIGIASNEFVRYPLMQDLQGLKWSPLNVDQNAFDILGGTPSPIISLITFSLVFGGNSIFSGKDDTINSSRSVIALASLYVPSSSNRPG